MSTRRDFMNRMAVGAAVVGGIPLTGKLETLAQPFANSTSPNNWDLSWTKRVSAAKYRGVFDSPEVESGLGVMRAMLWKGQVQDVLGAGAKDVVPVVVMRHVGIILAMQQSFWDKYGVGKMHHVTSPMTGAETDRNPVLMSAERGELPPMLDAFTVPRLVAAGGIPLACAVALSLVVEPMIQKGDNVSAEEAHTRAVAALIPGVILQPSGVFALVHAQDAGAKYVGMS